MDKIVKKILKKLKNNGFQAYIVGGYVRDYLLGKKSYDIDICTDALTKDLHKIFKGKSNKYGGFNFNIQKYNIDITTFRKELKYDKRKPIELKYIDSLEEDILRRDFTINAICMDKDGNIIDFVNGVNDLNKKVIKMIGKVDAKIKEDPLRILRAVRFASTLDFELENNLKLTIQKNSNLVSSLSSFKILQELEKILKSPNYLKGLNLLKELNLLKYLEFNYDKITYVENIYGMYAQINFSSKYTFTKKDNTNIINIRHIVESDNISNEMLYNYGLDNAIIASKIIKLDEKEVIKKYIKLPIKTMKDLKITNEEILKLTNKNVKIIKEELIKEILNERLKNNKKEIKKYIINRKD